MGEESTYMETGTCLVRWPATLHVCNCHKYFRNLQSCSHIRTYLVNDPEYYDEQRNSNSHENVDGKNQGVECSILL